MNGTNFQMDTDLSSAGASFIGEDSSDWSGWSVAGAGDVNGDGYDDLLISSVRNNEGGENAGQTYLVFGKETGWSMDMDLSLSDASFIGVNRDDNSGCSVAGAGDVNGDGLDDIIIGANATMNGYGWTHLIFGKESGWSMNTGLELSDAAYMGENSFDYSGCSVACAGDVNGDDFDDILIGAYGNDDAGNDAGKTYLILGKPSGWSYNMSLSDADASFIGEVAFDHSGNAVSGVGDVNGDGYDDILIGSAGNDDGGSSSGQTYLIFGKESGWSRDAPLSSADASFLGQKPDDFSGHAISGAGDVNGDGFDDILIGAYGSNNVGIDSGQTYLILGKSTGWGMDTPLSRADASFIVENSADYSGWSVSGTGNVNGDDFDDFLIGAYGDDEGGSAAGQTYLVLGKSSGWQFNITLSDGDASFIGEEAGDYSSWSISGAGDVNNDSFDDILIGAFGNDEGGNSAGQTYLILGYDDREDNERVCLNKSVWDPGRGVWTEGITTTLNSVVTFNITICNCGDATLKYVNVTDLLDPGLEYVAGSANHAPWSVRNLPGGKQEIVWGFYDQMGFYPGECFSIIFEAKVTTCGNHFNVANVYAQSIYSFGSDFVFDSNHAWVNVPCEPCLNLTKMVWDPVKEEWVKKINTTIGSTVTFKIMVYNCGNRTFDFINVTDKLMPGFDYIEGSATIAPDTIVDPIPMYGLTDTLLIWYPEIGPGENFTVEFKVNVTECGVLCNFVIVAAQIFGSNNYYIELMDRACVIVLCNGGGTNGYNRTCLRLIKEVWDPENEEWVDSLETSPGEEVTYRITLYNCGTTTVVTDLTDFMVEGLEYNEGSASTEPDDIEDTSRGTILTWESIELGPGESFNVTYTATADNQGSFCNIVKVDHPDLPGPVADIVCINITNGTEPEEPCVNITKTVWDPIAREWADEVNILSGPGIDTRISTVTFKIKVCNCGSEPIDIINIRLTDTMGSGLEYVEGSASIEPQWDVEPAISEVDGQEVLIWDLREYLSLHPDTGVTGYPGCVEITYKARVTGQGTFKNLVNLSLEFICCRGRISVIQDGDSALVTGISTIPDGDSDGDLIPDDWEVENGLNPYDSLDAVIDSDGDGYSNLEEFKEGTDPMDIKDKPGDGWIDPILIVLIAAVAIFAVGLLGLFVGSKMRIGSTETSNEQGAEE